MIIKKNNILFYLFCLITSIVALALCSFNSDDATWFSAHVTEAQIKNLLGSFGANFAALLLFTWGMAAYLFIPFLVFLACFFLKKRTIYDEWDKIIAWILCIVVMSITSALYHAAVFLPFSAGGYIGQKCVLFLSKYFDTFLIKLFLATCTFMSISLISRFSFIGLAVYMRKTMNYVFNKERVLEPLANIIIQSIRYIASYSYQKINACYSFLVSLFTGSFLEKYNENIVSFELDEIIKEVLHENENEIFYKPINFAVQKPAHVTENKPKIEDIYIQEIPHSIMTENEVVRPEIKNIPLEDKQLHQIKEEIIKEKVTNYTNYTQKMTYMLPYTQLFARNNEKLVTDEEKQVEEQLAMVLEEKLARFGIVGKVTSIKSGPVITLFEYQPDIDAKISKIIALEDDLALALQAVSIRIIAPIPGRSVVGFEVAKKKRRNVFLSSIISDDFQQGSGVLPLVFGQDTVGNNVIVDLVSMPHLLVAGSTGSGKSVALNTMLISLLYRKTPDELKLILIDPKRLEFAAYADIAHLLFPIVTEPKEASPVLQWVVHTMEERYQKMALCGVRNIFDYEILCKQNLELERLPYLVVIVDELSDLMMTVGKEIEGLIARIAQMSRAAGIHMIFATQRPSVDVITGLIKVNFPSRISFRVTSKVDSRTILDCVGAEKLLGKGDMLFLDSSSSGLRRVHGAYVSNAEIVDIVSFIRKQQKPNYLEIKSLIETQKGTLLEGDDSLYQEVITFIRTIDEISISLLQRRFRIGYNRSARIIEMLETEGHILPSDGSKMRKVVR